MLVPHLAIAWRFIPRLHWRQLIKAHEVYPWTSKSHRSFLHVAPLCKNGKFAPRWQRQIIDAGQVRAQGAPGVAANKTDELREGNEATEHS